MFTHRVQWMVSLPKPVESESTRRFPASSQGGGIYNTGNAVTLNGWSSITNNKASSQGGGIYNQVGTLNNAIDGGNVRNNTPDNIFTAP